MRIRIFSEPYFLTFGLNAEWYFVSLRIQSECRKIRTRMTTNTNNFCAVQTESLQNELFTRKPSIIHQGITFIIALILSLVLSFPKLISLRHVNMTQDLLTYKPKWALFFIVSSFNLWLFLLFSFVLLAD